MTIILYAISNIINIFKKRKGPKEIWGLFINGGDIPHMYEL